MRYASDGVLIPLNDLIEEHTVYLKEYLNNIPSVVKQYTAPDGNIYTLPMILNDDIEQNYHNVNVILMRKDWLAKLGFGCPQDDRSVP